MSFDDLINLEKLDSIYINKVSLKNSRGLDGISPKIFETYKIVHFNLIIDKCLNGSYKFTPFLQKLSSKGKNRIPRVISISTIRDKLVLSIMKDYLHGVFIDCINNKLPNCYIKEIGELILNNIENDHLCCYKSDLHDFYGTIDRPKLMSKLKTRINDQRVLNIIKRAISTPTVAYGYKRKDKVKLCDKKGIPQGLPISNILANIYLKDFDVEMDKVCFKYFRYVDDILVFNYGKDKECIKPIIKTSVEDLGLSVNTDKTDCVSTLHLDSCIIKKIEESAEFSCSGFKFGYLGYIFDGTKITVRASTVDKFINSFATKFTDFKNRTITDETDIVKSCTVFIDELNEKITGAISDNRQYGWIFYFMEINDLSLLFHIDNVIGNFFSMLNEFKYSVPKQLKKLSRSFYEVRKIGTSKYIHDYNKYETLEQKLAFLSKRGKLNLDKNYSIEEIELLFSKYKTLYLNQLEQDLGFFY